MDNITSEERRIIRDYLENGDKTSLIFVINHPWAYSVPMVQVAIALVCDMFPKRMACSNSITVEE